MQLKPVELWLDMQLSPQLAGWITKQFSIKAFSSYNLKLNIEKDEAIFFRAKKKGNVIILTKDKDFAEIVDRLQSPPKIIFLKVGNCSNERMKEILTEHLLFCIEELINILTQIVEINPKNIF